MMSDPQLQKYAAMHKNDPYIFPMAFAESNMRKEARAAQQAQAMGQQQPKVVDQDLMEMGQPPMPPQDMPPQGMPPQGMPPQGMPPQGMPPQGMPPQGGPQMAQQQLPENQGIGALPAPNMQRMADGGIAGYGDDDDNEFNYAGADDSVVMMAGGGVAHFADKGAVRGPYNDDTTMYDPATGQPFTGDYTTGGTDDRTILEKLGVFNPENRRANEKTEREMRMRKNAGSGLDIPFDAGRGDSWDNEPTEKETSKKKSGASGGGKKPAASANVIPPEETKAVATAKAAPTGADLIAQAIEGSSALNAESAAAFKPYHDQLNKENEEILGRKADNRAYALLAAGLGMMGGTSQYAAVNIAAGGIKGLAVYQEAEKADAAARKANQQSQMLLMQAERAERSGNMKVAGDMQSRAEQARQFAITAEQKAEELKDMKEYRKGEAVTHRIQANAAMLSAQNRGGGLYGAEDKHMVALAKVQSVLNSNPVYKEAAKNATMPGNIGATARATVAQIERDTYSRFAPELLQSGQGSPSGSGGGQKVLDFNSIK
jgi:hypothetical protein